MLNYVQLNVIFHLTWSNFGIYIYFYLFRILCGNKKIYYIKKRAIILLYNSSDIFSAPLLHLYLYNNKPK